MCQVKDSLKVLSLLHCVWNKNKRVKKVTEDPLLIVRYRVLWTKVGPVSGLQTWVTHKNSNYIKWELLSVESLLVVFLFTTTSCSDGRCFSLQTGWSCLCQAHLSILSSRIVSFRFSYCSDGDAAQAMTLKQYSHQKMGWECCRQGGIFLKAISTSLLNCTEIRQDFPQNCCFNI